jgi:hypothetical protein
MDGFMPRAPFAFFAVFAFFALAAACSSSKVQPSNVTGSCSEYVAEVENSVAGGDGGSRIGDGGSELGDAGTGVCINLPPSDAGPVKCILLATLTAPGSESACATLGVPTPDANTLMQFRAQQETAWQSTGGATSGQPDPAKLPVCALPQLTGSDLDVNGSCASASKPGFCLVMGTNCGVPAVVVSPSGWLNGALITVDCRNGC